ncbi:hypothetical protein EAI_11726, partial [Harpegnathos saltator]
FWFWNFDGFYEFQNATKVKKKLRQRITNGFENIRENPEVQQRVRDSLERRLRACIYAEGGHFEHLI